MSFFLVSLALAILVGVLRHRALEPDRPACQARPLPRPAPPVAKPAGRAVIDATA